MDFSRKTFEQGNALANICKSLERPTNYQIMEDFNLLEGHPWVETARSQNTNYYACLFGVAAAEEPRKILEIGTAFGMSGASLIKAMAKVELFISLDLGIYGQHLGMEGNNIDFSRQHIHAWCNKHSVPVECVHFFRANTQPPGKGDNNNLGDDVPHWQQLPDVVRLLQDNQFDIIFTDGKHTEDGLLNDMRSFWPYLKPGGLLICDDMHDPVEFSGMFSWVGDTWASFHTFLEMNRNEIAEHYIWKYPCVTPGGKKGSRPFGLVRKVGQIYPIAIRQGYETFDSTDARMINQARQDHLASLGLDLANQSVLEVGAGVGWHTSFFEKFGCTVLSTDSRSENNAEHLFRYPYRKGKVELANLNDPGSHDRFGDFDIIYCYGVLYHLSNPSLCLKDLAKKCKKLFLLETCVNHIDNGAENFVSENASNPNQSFDGLGCRPGRDWVMNELARYFPYVYLTTTQPDYPDFVLTWPNAVLTQGNFRSVFVASRNALELPSLSSILSNSQSRVNTISRFDTYRNRKEENPIYVQGSKQKKDEAFWDRLGPEELVLIYQLDPSSYIDIEYNIYGQDSDKETHWNYDELVFYPTTAQDHLATPFINLGAGDGQYPDIWMEIGFSNDLIDLHPPVIIVQDQSYNVIETSIARPGNSKLKFQCRFPHATKQIRIVIMGPNGQPCHLPEIIRIVGNAAEFNEQGIVPPYAFESMHPKNLRKKSWFRELLRNIQQALSLKKMRK